jgi:selenocysteine-specific elongation factor
MARFIAGTAGHIDHGKSTLVRALTGIDPDRLPEEKRRGITIDLGFAHTTLADGVQAAFVDVPGHEKFVRAMVAGAHGVDVVLLVVASDEGVMPQTREHADICRLLGLQRAVIALTKSDLLAQLDPEWQALVEDDIRKLGPLFESAPIVRVSATTGEGLDALKRALSEAAREVPRRRTEGPAFLPIDRVFSIRGHGTVVTGTLLAGRLAVEDVVDVVVPAPRSAGLLTSRRIRSLQVHGQAANRVTAGQRVAVNIVADVAEIPRGSALAGAGTGDLRQGALLDVELEMLDDVPALKNRARLTIHLGTAHAQATVDLLGRGEAEPGSRSVAQLRLDRALPAVRDQQFVLRGFRGLAHGGRTVAGGRILLLDNRRRRAANRPLLETLLDDATSAAAALVGEAGTRGLDKTRLIVALACQQLLPRKDLAERGGRLFDPKVFPQLRDQIADLVRKQGPVGREDIRSRLGPAVDPAAFAEAVSLLGAEFSVGDRISVVGAPGDPLADRVETLLSEGRWAPPTAPELAVALAQPRARIDGSLRSLARDGRAVRLTDELFVHAAAAAEFRAVAVEKLRAKGSLTMLEFKDLIGTTRKFVVPLCEWLDREHVTIRVGEKRVLRGQGT